MPRPRLTLPGVGRLLPVLLGAVVVIAGMLAPAERSRRAADDARQAQIAMERIRVLSEKLDSITWRSLGTQRSSAPAGTVAQGVEAYRELAVKLRELRKLGVPRRRVAEIEVPLGATYGLGVQTIVLSHRSP